MTEKMFNVICDVTTHGRTAIPVKVTNEVLKFADDVVNVITYNKSQGLVGIESEFGVYWCRYENVEIVE